MLLGFDDKADQEHEEPEEDPEKDSRAWTAGDRQCLVPSSHHRGVTCLKPQRSTTAGKKGAAVKGDSTLINLLNQVSKNHLYNAFNALHCKEGDRKARG